MTLRRKTQLDHCCAKLFKDPNSKMSLFKEAFYLVTVDCYPKISKKNVFKLSTGTADIAGFLNCTPKIIPDCVHFRKSQKVLNHSTLSLRGGGDA